MVRIIQEWDGVDSLMSWISNPNELLRMHTSSKNLTLDTYQRLKAHAHSVGLDVTIVPEYKSKLIITIDINDSTTAYASGSHNS